MKKIHIIFALAAALSTVACVDTDEGTGGLPEVITLDATEITRSTAVLNGETRGGEDNMLTRGVCFSLSDQVSFEDQCVSVIRGSGKFSAKTNELDPVTKYYIRAFAVMKDGKIIYGDLKDFTTSNFQLATIAMLEPTDIRSTEVTLHASITDEGDYPITSCGFVYSLSPGAELDAEGSTAVTLDNTASEMTRTILQLTIGTTYYAKAFAVTSQGVAYSEEISFTTGSDAPAELAPISVDENTFTSLTVSSSIVNPHGEVTSYGFCWSLTNPIPTTDDSSIDLTDKTFAHTITELLPSQKVYMRAWAVNNAGLNYGSLLEVRVKTYDCGGNMALVTPPSAFYIGWLGDPSDTQNPALYSQARDSTYSFFYSANSTYTNASRVVDMKPYRIAKYEVTNADYVAFLNIYGSQTVKEGEYAGKRLLYIDEGGTRITYDASSGTWSVPSAYEQHPVVGVTWYGANEFCRFFGGFLPSEPQWENAARGNVYSDDPAVPMYRFSGSNNIEDVAVFNQLETSPVGTKQPNQLGIYDMTGNAQEWTSTWWSRSYPAVYTEPTRSSATIVCRGCRCQRGAMQYFLNCSREGFAIDSFTANKSNYIGFRFCDDNVSGE